MLNSSFLTYEFMEKSCFHDWIFMLLKHLWNRYMDYEINENWIWLSYHAFAPRFLITSSSSRASMFLLTATSAVLGRPRTIRIYAMVFIICNRHFVSSTFFFFVKTNVCTYRISLLHQENPTTISFYKIWDKFTQR